MDKKLLLTLAQKSIYILLGLVNMVMLAKILGANNFGIYTYLLTISMILSVFCHQGFPLYSTRIYGIAKNNKSINLLQSYIDFSEKKILLWSAFVVVVFSYFVYLKGYDLTYEIILTFSLVILFMSISQNRAGILRGLGFVPWSFLPEQIIRPMVIFICIYLMYKGVLNNELPTALIMYLVATFLAFLAGSVMIKYKLNSGSTHKQSKELTKVVDNKVHRSESLKLLYTAILFQLLNNIDIILIGQFLSYADVALYKLCLQAAFFSNLICQAYGQICAHKFAIDSDEQTKIRLAKVYSVVKKRCIIFTIPLIVAITVISPFVINFAIGESYYKAFLMVIVLAIGQFSNSLYGPAALFLNMRKNTNYVNTVTLWVILVFSSLGIIFVYSMGLIALAVCIAVGFHVWNYFLYKKVRLYLYG